MSPPAQTGLHMPPTKEQDSHPSDEICNELLTWRVSLDLPQWSSFWICVNRQIYHRKICDSYPKNGVCTKVCIILPVHQPPVMLTQQEGPTTHHCSPTLSPQWEGVCGHKMLRQWHQATTSQTKLLVTGTLAHKITASFAIANKTNDAGQQVPPPTQPTPMPSSNLSDAGMQWPEVDSTTNQLALNKLTCPVTNNGWEAVCCSDTRLPLHWVASDSLAHKITCSLLVPNTQYKLVSSGSGIPWPYQNCGTLLDSLDWYMRKKEAFWKPALRFLQTSYVKIDQWHFSVNVWGKMWWYVNLKKYECACRNMWMKIFAMWMGLQMDLWVDLWVRQDSVNFHRVWLYFYTYAKYFEWKSLYI